jgi:hypothetical protein
VLLAHAGLIWRRNDIKHAPVVAAIQVERSNTIFVASRGARAPEELSDSVRCKLGPVVGVEENGHAGAGSDTGVLRFHFPRYRHPRHAGIRRTTQT